MRQRMVCFSGAVLVPRYKIGQYQRVKCVHAPTAYLSEAPMAKALGSKRSE